MDSIENDFIKTERRKIPYAIFALNPTRSIKQLLGQDIVIKSYVVNDIITDDECYIVDIEYYSIKFSPIKIFYINVTDLKQLIPESGIYVTQIDGCNIRISSPLIKEYKKIIPMRINVSIPNNYSSHGQLEYQFSYFGIIVRKPMNYLCTPLKYPGHKFTPFKMDDVKPIYPSDYKFTPISEEETKVAYKSEIQQFPILKTVDNLVITKSFEECKMGTTGYLIDINKFPSDTDINGIILIQPIRIPSIVLFFPTMGFTICSEEMNSIKEFVTMDEINAINFDYCMNVMNK